MGNLSPDVVKMQEAGFNLAKTKEMKPFNEALQQYAQQVNAINRVSTGDPEKILPPDLEEMRTKLEAIEKLMVTNDPSVTQEMRDQYVMDYETYMARAIPYLEKEIAKLKKIAEEEEMKRSGLAGYLAEGGHTQGIHKELGAEAEKHEENEINANIKRIKLEAALTEIEAGPQVGHCTIENKSPEVLKVEKYLQLEMVGDEESYDVSTVVDKYASSLADILDIKTYCTYVKGNNLYFTYIEKGTNDIVTWKFSLNKKGDGIIVILKINDKAPKESTKWKLPNPPINRDLGMKG